MKLNFTLTSPYPIALCRRYFTDLSLYLKAHTKPGMIYTITDTTRNSDTASYTVLEKRTIIPEKHNPHNRSVSWSSTHEVITNSNSIRVMTDHITHGQGKGTVTRISLEEAALSTPQSPATLITYDLDFALGKLPSAVLLLLRSRLKEAALSSADLDLSAIAALAKQRPLSDTSGFPPPTTLGERPQ